MRRQVLDHSNAIGVLRSGMIKSCILLVRISVPALMYFLDTYLWFSWTCAIFSTAIGWWIRMGKVLPAGGLVGLRRA